MRYEEPINLEEKPVSVFKDFITRYYIILIILAFLGEIGLLILSILGLILILRFLIKLIKPNILSIYEDKIEWKDLILDKDGMIVEGNMNMIVLTSKDNSRIIIRPNNFYEPEKLIDEFLVKSKKKKKRRT